MTAAFIDYVADQWLAAGYNGGLPSSPSSPSSSSATTTGPTAATTHPPEVYWQVLQQLGIQVSR